MGLQLEYKRRLLDCDCFATYSYNKYLFFATNHTCPNALPRTRSDLSTFSADIRQWITCVSDKVIVTLSVEEGFYAVR